MSSLAKIRAALAKVVEDNVATELHVYQNVPDVAQVPAFVVEPRACNFTGAFGRGDDVWEFDCYVLVARTETENSQDILDDLLTGAGESSIRQAIWNNGELGLEDCQAFVKSMAGYGGEFQSARVRHVGAILKVTVHTDGSVI